MYGIALWYAVMVVDSMTVVQVLSKKVAGAYGSRTHRRRSKRLPTDLKSAKPTGTQTLPSWYLNYRLEQILPSFAVPAWIIEYQIRIEK